MAKRRCKNKGPLAPLYLNFCTILWLWWRGFWLVSAQAQWTFISKDEGELWRKACQHECSSRLCCVKDYWPLCSAAWCTNVVQYCKYSAKVETQSRKRLRTRTNACSCSYLHSFQLAQITALLYQCNWCRQCAQFVHVLFLTSNFSALWAIMAQICTCEEILICDIFAWMGLWCEIQGIELSASLSLLLINP